MVSLTNLIKKAAADIGADMIGFTDIDSERTVVMGFGVCGQREYHEHCLDNFE